MAICPGLHTIIAKFVQMQEQRQNEANFDEEVYCYLKFLADNFSRRLGFFWPVVLAK